MNELLIHIWFCNNVRKYIVISCHQQSSCCRQIQDPFPQAAIGTTYVLYIVPPHKISIIRLYRTMRMFPAQFAFMHASSSLFIPISPPVSKTGNSERERKRKRGKKEETTQNNQFKLEQCELQLHPYLACVHAAANKACLLYTSPSPRDQA